MGLTKHPRYRLATLPTPLHELPRLTEHFGGPRLFIKRDDLTGLAFGGNKTRKLEYLVADAIGQGATHLITAGGIQSNHVRQTAAAARVAGLKADLVLQSDDERPVPQGNYLLDRLLGAACHLIPHSRDVASAMQEVAGERKENGDVPYIIPVGGSSPVGALGYVSAMLELNAQLWEQGIAATHLYHAAGSGGTQAGIVLGATVYGAEYEVRGVAVSGSSAQKVERANEIVEATAQLLELPHTTVSDRVIVDDSQVGEGYGIPTEGTLEAIQMLARLEGIFLDPVYTGKAMAGLIADIRTEKLTASDTVVFLHSGGTPALFAKLDEIAPIT